jgi:hypothetical protein
MEDLFQGSSFHKRGMPPFMQKEIGNFILWRMDNGFETLEMSDAQQDQYDKFCSRLEKSIETGVETRMGFKKQAMLEFEKEPFVFDHIIVDNSKDLKVS